MDRSSTSTSTSNRELGNSREGVFDQAKHAVTHVTEQTKEQVSDQLSTKFGSGKDKALQTMGTVAEAIRGTSEKLKGVGPLGDVAERAANRIEDVADFFETKKIGDVVREVERFARREPALFLGATFALGLISGRFLKSSARGPASSNEREVAYGDGWGDEDLSEADAGPRPGTF